MLVMPYLNEMLFKTNSLTEVLIVYVFQIVPLSIILTFTAILQGYGKLKTSFISHNRFSNKNYIKCTFNWWIRCTRTPSQMI